MIQPDVSVIIPTYNRKELLRQSITSCFNGNETIDVEVVVVDDGSTDGTRGYLKRLEDERIQPIFQRHKGGQHARNYGLSEARGEYVKFLDDDDWLKEGALRIEYDALKTSGADISYGTYDFVKSDGTVLEREEASLVKDPVAALFSSELLTHPLRFTYRQALLEDIWWNPELPCRQDVDFALRAATKDPQFVRVDATVGCFRQHEGDRVSSTADRSDGVDPSRIHADILWDAVVHMERDDTLNSGRKKAAARGLWTWAHLLAVQNWPLFRKMHNKIIDLDPTFTPQRNYYAISVLDKMLGTRVSEGIFIYIRKIARAIWER